MKVSQGKGYAPQVTKCRDLTWLQFVRGLSKPRTLSPDQEALGTDDAAIKKQKAVAGWIALAEFRDDYRSTENVAESHGIGLDFDTGTEAATIEAALAGLNFVMVSTFQHYLDNVTPRYRVFIPYAVPITEEIVPTHARVWAHFKQLLPSLDLACADVGRLWYMPVVRPDMLDKFEHRARDDGAPFDWRELPEPDPLATIASYDRQPDGDFQPGTFHKDFLRLAGRLRRGGVDYDSAELAIIAKCEAVGAEPAHHLRTLQDVFQKYAEGEAFEGTTEQRSAVDFAAEPLPEDIATRDFPEHPCAIDGYVPQLCVTLFASQDGLGKSRVALQMLAHVAAGRPLYGHIDCGHGEPAYYLNKEDPKTEVWRRLRWIMQDFTAEERTRLIRNLRIASPMGQVELVAQGSGVILTPQVDQLIETVGRARLVVMDTLSRMHGLEENNNSVGARLIGAAERVARETGAGVVLVHHTGKAAARDGVEGAGASRGAHALEGNSRSVVRLVLPGKQDSEQFHLPAGALKLVQAKFSYGRKRFPIWLRSDEFGVLQPFVPKDRGADTPEGPAQDIGTL